MSGRTYIQDVAVDQIREQVEGAATCHVVSTTRWQASWGGVGKRELEQSCSDLKIQVLLNTET